jgi:RNA-directed DNA polymerase
LSAMGDWCKEHLHKPLPEQHRMLSAKLRGHYQYYGVRGNFKMLEVAYEHTRVMWKKWLRRRNSMNRMSWERFTEQVERTLALPLPRIVHVF